MATVKSPNRVLQVALGLGWCVDLLFYGKRIGISVPLFVLLVLGSLFVLGRLERANPALPNLWLLLPVAFFATMVFVRANAWLTFLNLTALFVLLALMALFAMAGRVDRLALMGYPVGVLLVIGHMVGRAGPDVATVVRSTSHHRAQARRAAPLVRGVMLALPVLALFTALLASADTIFAGYMSKFSRFDYLSGTPEMLWRATLILTAAWLIAGGFLFALGQRGTIVGPVPGLPASGFTLSRFSIGFAEAATVLALVDGLFAIFSWIQIANVFLGRPASMHYEAYREYVRRGFGELLVVAVLTMLLILGLRWAAWKETPREMRVLDVLSTLMVVLALVILVSAFQRLLTWESIQFYISTPLRLYIRAFMVWLGLLFVWLLFTMWFKPERFAIGAFVAAICFMVTINLMNPDADVATYNLRRQDELSTRYLELLSDDAVPALVAGLESSSGDVLVALREQLSYRLYVLETDPNRQYWQSFHLAGSQAYDMLTALSNQGKIDKPFGDLQVEVTGVVRGAGF
ncbi:MAG: DUF4153 domain-containing protein [Chloroflexia bacterium]